MVSEPYIKILILRMSIDIALTTLVKRVDSTLTQDESILPKRTLIITLKFGKDSFKKKKFC